MCWCFVLKGGKKKLKIVESSLIEVPENHWLFSKGFFNKFRFSYNNNNYLLALH